MNPDTQAPNTPFIRKRHTSTTVSQKYRSFEKYLRVIQQQIHPSCKISASSLNALNKMVNSLFKRIASEAKELALKQKRPTLLARDIEFACRLVLPEELTKEALVAGGTALKKYEDTTKRETAARL